MISPERRINFPDHEIGGRIAGEGGYVTLEAGVVSVRRHDGKVVLEMTEETWTRLGKRLEETT